MLLLPLLAVDMAVEVVVVVSVCVCGCCGNVNVSIDRAARSALKMAGKKRNNVFLGVGTVPVCACLCMCVYVFSFFLRNGRCCRGFWWYINCRTVVSSDTGLPKWAKLVDSATHTHTHSHGIYGIYKIYALCTCRNPTHLVGSPR